MMHIHTHNLKVWDFFDPMTITLFTLSDDIIIFIYEYLWFEDVRAVRNICTNSRSLFDEKKEKIYDFMLRKYLNLVKYIGVDDKQFDRLNFTGCHLRASLERVPSFHCIPIFCSKLPLEWPSHMIGVYPSSVAILNPINSIRIHDKPCFAFQGDALGSNYCIVANRSFPVQDGQHHVPFSKFIAHTFFPNQVQLSLSRFDHIQFYFELFYNT